MWTCINCRTDLRDHFDVCWRCGTSRGGEGDPDFVTADEAGPVADPRGDLRLVIGEVPVDKGIDGPMQMSRGMTRFASAVRWSLLGGLVALTLSAVASFALLVMVAKGGSNEGSGVGLFAGMLGLFILVATGLGLVAGAIVGMTVGARKHP